MDIDANQELIREAVDAGWLAGAVTLVWHRGQIRQVAATGRRDIARDLPMRRDTLFRIASMTKPIATAAAMSLVDEGVLRLDDPITTWAPEFDRARALKDPAGPLEATEPLARPITVRDLLTHQCGIGYQFTTTGPISEAYGQLPRGNPDEWLAALAALPLVHQPGAAMTYGHSTDVLGILLARAAGTTTRSVLRERVLDPLGMSDTDFTVAQAEQDRLAVLYRTGPDHVLEQAPIRPAQAEPPAFCRAGEGLIGTADDYLRFARMLLGNGQVDGVRVLSAQSASLMRADHMTPRLREQPFLGLPWTGRSFGLGLGIVTDPVRSRHLFGPAGAGSFGWPGAYGTWWQADPEHDLVLLYLVQHGSAVPDPDAVLGKAAHLLRRVQPEFAKRSYRALGLIA